ncbi:MULTISPECIES: hypothetical protein [Mycobacteriaceae]|uniref:DUF732 domain-containing protein n=1 Tax=Mycobacteroides immunogenum TaxID=83262 RepID=A0A7V8RX57_9MYCO|nr:MULTISPECIES: hypothetical protein [Mycobacteriaceae]AMT69435.1 hypothetical protein ABG82_02820 [Mycobacteroides immunogenum]ANO02475.1 hypothetical protein BAB75_02825 [Mycobacteroides immunogenum]KIU38720.1 hypothetical protein TL11_20850 [Mycobacteroides immunogenum]KPG08588.1 hypothetical protein AN909_14895 [Mycobacteroides immunogenum]KPG08841.1 hypothetical protein AN910_18200 [Mycobacteroides immunogenum]
MNRNFRGRAVAWTLAATAAATLLMAPAAQAGPGSLGDADDVINSLKAQGNKVIITKTGNKPLSQCVATRIRKDLDVYGNPRIYPNISSGPTRRTWLYSVYHVDVQC